MIRSSFTLFLGRRHVGVYRLFEVSRDAVTVRLHKVNAPSCLSMPGVWVWRFHVT
jgi:hypothetical protein